MKLIYIIEDGSGNKKIGITSDIIKRVKQLKTVIPTGIVSVMVSNFVENARSIEKQLHDANKAYRLNGEWFSNVVDFGDIEFSYSNRETPTKIEYEAIELLPKSICIKLYTTDLGNLFRLPVGTTGVLMCIASMVDYQGVVVLNGYFKESVAKRLNSKLSKHGKPSISVVNKAITELLAKGIIDRIGSSTYQLNPNLFARGKWRDIYEQRKAFKVTITYTDDGAEGKREVVTEQIGADIIQIASSKNVETI